MKTLPDPIEIIHPYFIFLPIFLDRQNEKIANMGNTEYVIDRLNEAKNLHDFVSGSDEILSRYQAYLLMEGKA